MLQAKFDIGTKQIGSGYPCFIIAEAGVNHNGDINLARRMVQAAAWAGADAVKFQAFNAKELVTADASKAEYQKQHSQDKESQLEMLQRLSLKPETFAILQKECISNRIMFLCTPFDDESADMLAELDIAAYKIGSGEITNLPFLAYVAHKGKPMILSTGMSNLGEVEMAVQTILSTGNSDLAILHCTSSYPADPTDINLRAMETLRHAFQLCVGYSDHSDGIEIPLAAAALGASIIEKHFTLDRTLPGPDQAASLEPEELVRMVHGIRKVEASMGHGRKEPAESESNAAAVVRKSLVARIHIPAGTCLEDRHIAIMRPGTGLSPAMLSYVLGRTVQVDIPEGKLISIEMFR